MIHTTHLEDEYIGIKELRKRISHHKQDISLENRVDGNVVLEEYMSVEEFRKEAKMNLTKILNEHGIY